MSVHLSALPAQRTRGQGGSSCKLPPRSATTLQCSRPSSTCKMRRRTATTRSHGELAALQEAVEQWVRQLRR